VEVVITTEEEKTLIRHQRILAVQHGMKPLTLVNEASRIIQGKDHFERITIGVDPGEVFGVAVIADGKVIETDNCFSVEQTLGKIVDVVETFDDVKGASISVKIGDGVPQCKEVLLSVLDEALPPRVSLESVGESGTSRSMSEAKHRRGIRDIVSAIQIAGRSGRRFQRRRIDGSNC
jgi:hypothetical protein